MLEVETIQGRQIGGAEVAEVQGLIGENPRWSRWRLSRVLAERWQWRAASGQLKDMAARTLLVKLHGRGWIVLPERRGAPGARKRERARGLEDGADLFDALAPAPVAADLAALRPLRIQAVGRRQPEYPLFERYLAQYHYLGYGGPVGENVGYLVRSGAGADLACLLFGAAAWQCAPREAWIGWSAEQRARSLSRLANNSRFLILPWVRCAGLASHILSEIARRIDADWQGRYGHGLDLLETFVQRDRFQGSCYRAANWRRAGQTTGRTRQSARFRDNRVHAPVKDIYLYPLHADARRHLCR